MRSVAPESAGIEASQNSSSVLYLKPAAGSCVTTALHTIHTAKARNSAGIEIHRFWLASALPWVSQKALSSGVHSVSTRLARGWTVSLMKNLRWGELGCV